MISLVTFFLYTGQRLLPSYYQAIQLIGRLYPLQPVYFDICLKGCILFTNSSITVCPVCDKNRYKAQGPRQQPVRQLMVLPVGDQIGLMLYHRQTRDLLLHDYDIRINNSTYKDIFDGSVFGDLVLDGDWTNIYVGIYFDGFTSKDKKSQALGVIHIIIFNIDPTKRYHKTNMLQYAILPGPKLPAKNDMWTYIKPLYKELKTLEDIGLVVKCDDGCSRKVKVHCLMVTGDIPAVSSVAGLLGHSSLFPCRLCTIKKVLPRNSVTNNNNNNNNNNRTRNTRYLPIGHSEEPRTKSDFRRQRPDEANGVSLGTDLANLESCTGPYFFGLDELHLFGHGIAHQLFKLFEGHYNGPNATSDGPNKLSFSTAELDGLKKTLNDSRPSIPTSLKRSFRLPGGAFTVRAVDWKALMCYVYPSVFVP
ncbi:hypothetical protein, partial, partial [Absidia glauca]